MQLLKKKKKKGKDSNDYSIFCITHKWACIHCKSVIWFRNHSWCFPSEIDNISKLHLLWCTSDVTA